MYLIFLLSALHNNYKLLSNFCILYTGGIVMLFNCFVLAISSSIDSLGIGVTYGIKNKKISFWSTIILFIISLLVSFVSVFSGKILLNFLPKYITELIGCFILFCIGFFVIVKAIFEFNNSNLIDPKEAVFLGLALSLDNFGIGISSSLISTSYILFPILISIFQFIFLSLGIIIGKKVSKFIGFSDFICSILSGILLVLIGFLQFFAPFS